MSKRKHDLTTKNPKVLDKGLRVYISGQITGLEKDISEHLFEKAEMHLIDEGFTDVVNPIKIKHEHDQSWESFMVEDIRALLGCSIIYMLSNWKNSRGARIEHYIAIERKLKIIYQK